jgi:hypothetical protein
MALSDAENDIGMLRLPGIVSFAMGHASGAVKAAAQFSTASNAGDGAAQVLESFLLGGEAPVFEGEKPVFSLRRSYAESGCQVYFIAFFQLGLFLLALRSFPRSSNIGKAEIAIH